MKNQNLFVLLMLSLIAQSLLVSCSSDDSNDGANRQVTISDDGSVSSGSNFVSIDDKNFYLDYIKYTIEEGHLVVTGYDKAGFKGTANIVSKVTYKGNSLEVLAFKRAAFDNCSTLTSVTIPNSVTYIGGYTFRSCISLNSITIPNSVTYIGSSAFQYCSGLTSITILNGVASIGDAAFDGCTSLTSITIPNSVTSIERAAFSNCTGLTSFTIPNSVKTIDSFVLSGCTSLTSINVETGNTIYDSRDNCNAIIKTDDNTLITGCKKSTIPNSIMSIGSGAFCDCKGLTSITIPNGVTSIGSFAFERCSDLITVTIPNSVTSIDNYAFAYCTSLATITIPNSLTSIGDAAFSRCTSLTTITIPNSVTSIGSGAFEECNGLTSIHCENTNPQKFYGVFSQNIYQSATLYVPKGSIKEYNSSEPWCYFINIVEE